MVSNDMRAANSPTKVTLVKHPLCEIRLGILRNKNSSSTAFRAALKDISQFLIYTTLSDMQTETMVIETPITQTTAAVLTEKIVFIPILRAGLGMLDPALTLIPEAEVGFIGVKRDESTHKANAYSESLPEDLSQATVFLLDPMLATGGSLALAVKFLAQHGAKDITVISIIAAPEGVRVIESLPEVSRIFLGALDQKLDDNAYIYPGLGDAGDRQFPS